MIKIQHEKLHCRALCCYGHFVVVVVVVVVAVVAVVAVVDDESSRFGINFIVGMEVWIVEGAGRGAGQTFE